MAPGSQSITALNAAKTHCHRGHDITGDGAYKTKDGRACKVCKRASMRDYYQRRKARAA